MSGSIGYSFKRRTNGKTYLCVYSSCSPHHVDSNLLSQIPFRNFVRTNHGELSDIQLSMSPMLRSIGISLLGGNAGIAGKYELNVDTFRIVNEEDAVSDLGMFLYFSYV